MRGSSMKGPDHSGKLGDLRLASERALVGVIWAHGPALLLIGLQVGVNLPLALCLWAGIAVVATASHRANPGTAATRATLATSLCLMPALLVLELANSPWQIDAHMHFFAVLAVAAALLDWQAVVAGAGVIAVHHLALDLFLPALVFPGGANLGRVLFHAVILIFEASTLAWLVARAARAMTESEAAAREIARLATVRQNEDAARVRQQVAETRSSATLSIATEIDSALGSIAAGLVTSSFELNASTDVLSAATARASSQAARSAESGRYADTSVQTVAAATEEMTASTSRINQRVVEAADAAQQALQDVRATDATVRELAEGAARIADVVRVIGSIAAQTNLLALNATIEAARAGEQGRGFAVVASEVKTLARQTATATEEIGRQIAQMQDVTGRAVTAISGIGSSVERTSGIAVAIAAAIQEQEAATQEIARAAQQAASGTADVSGALLEVHNAVAESEVSVSSMRQLSAAVAEQGKRLRSEVDAFSTRLRGQAASA